jgi:hypothetical protein
MFDLFRFIVLRPAEPAPLSAAIEVGGESPLMGALEAARGANPALPAMRRIADAFVDGPNYLGDPSTQVPAAALLLLLEDLRNGKVENATDLDTYIRKRLGAAAKDSVGQSQHYSRNKRILGRNVPNVCAPSHRRRHKTRP